MVTTKAEEVHKGIAEFVIADVSDRVSRPIEEFSDPYHSTGDAKIQA